MFNRLKFLIIALILLVTASFAMSAEEAKFPTEMTELDKWYVFDGSYFMTKVKLCSSEEDPTVFDSVVVDHTDYIFPHLSMLGKITHYNRVTDEKGNVTFESIRMTNSNTEAKAKALTIERGSCPEGDALLDTVYKALVLSGKDDSDIEISFKGSFHHYQ